MRKLLLIGCLLTVAFGCTQSNAPKQPNSAKLEGITDVASPKGENKQVAPPK
jgi:hypothetical protein